MKRASEETGKSITVRRKSGMRMWRRRRTVTPLGEGRTGTPLGGGRVTLKVPRYSASRRRGRRRRPRRVALHTRIVLKKSEQKSCKKPSNAACDTYRHKSVEKKEESKGIDERDTGVSYDSVMVVRVHLTHK